MSCLPPHDFHREVKVPVPRESVLARTELLRANLGLGSVKVHGLEFFETWLVCMRDRYQKKLKVDVWFDRNDLSRIRVFDPHVDRWLKVRNLYPEAFSGVTLEEHRARQVALGRAWKRPRRRKAWVK
jgi:hypothetical protein